MIVKLSGCYKFTSYKIDKNLLNEFDRRIVDRVTKDGFMEETKKRFHDYDTTLQAYKEGFITKQMKDNTLSDLYEESGYSDMYDFYNDYRRWKVGLPIYIEFRLV